MDPVTLATVTASLTTLAMDCATDVASEAGKKIWSRIKSMLGWEAEPEVPELAPAIAEQLHANQELAGQVVRVLQQEREAVGVAASLVGNIDAEKVIIIKDQTVAGDFNIQM